MLTQELRPKKFSELVGCEEQSLLLKSCILKEDRPSTYVLCGKFGSGKAQPVDLIIPTPSGNRRFGDLCVGDYVFNRYGKPTKVIGVFPRGKLDNYKITLEDGRSTYCNDDHLWTVRYNSHSSHNGKTIYRERVISTNEMISNGLFKRGNTSRYKIPMNGVAEYEDVELPIDPYVLGCFLGNGCLKERSLTISSADTFVVNRIANILNCVPVKCSDSNYSYKFKMKNQRFEKWNNKFYSYIRTRDLFRNDNFDLTNILSKDKYIPSIYKYSSVKQRLSLINGLFDTDGTISNDSKLHVNYHTVSHRLVMDIKDILTSLGMKCSIREYVRENRNVCYVLFVNIPNHMKTNLFSLPRKLERGSKGKNIIKRKDYEHLSIVSIEKMKEQKEMMCIKVESEDGLYLTNDYIVTHNTTSARLFARGINCVNFSKHKDICGECSFCRANLNTVPWYLELDASQVGNVDSVRAMQDMFYPVSAYTRVIVFDEAHLISRQAQSALLKMFEDTPSGVIFILATTDPENILETIKNRSLIIYYSQKSNESIYGHVKSKFPNLKEETVKKVVEDSHGIMRECHMILERINLIGEEKYNELNFSLDSYFTDYLKALLIKDKELLFKSIDGISTRPVATIKVEYQNYLYNLVRDSFNIESLGDSVRDNIIKGLQKGNKLIPIVRLLGQDWVMSSFRSQIEMNTALMAIYQQMNLN